MSKQSVATNYVGYRGELLAELFLQELNPVFVAKSTDPTSYDFVVGFANRNQEINTFAVEVKATERGIPKRFPISHFNVARFEKLKTPIMLLVVDVKLNEFGYAWLDPKLAMSSEGDATRISLTKVDASTRTKLIEELTAARAPSATRSRR